MVNERAVNIRLTQLRQDKYSDSLQAGGGEDDIGKEQGWGSAHPSCELVLCQGHSELPFRDAHI